MSLNAKNYEVLDAYAEVEHHFSGGLRGRFTNRGVSLYPVSDDEDANALVFPNQPEHAKFTLKECGFLFLGSCVKNYIHENRPPMEVWESGPRDKSNNLNAADAWGSISYQANQAGDSEYADYARYISISLRSASLRLKQVSNHYHNQLLWALADKKKSGQCYANYTLDDIHADFHSLVSELSSVRDYIATIAGLHADAPKGIDSLARLEGWVNKPINENSKNIPLINILLSASGTAESPDWLRRLGDIRNEMLHRIPMGANKNYSCLILLEKNTSYGAIKTIRLANLFDSQISSKNEADPLDELSTIHIKLEHLCREICKLAKYEVILPEFKL